MKNILIQPSFTDRETHSLNLYLNDLSKFPVLTKTQEVELFKAYK
jgi:RNA polymerase primary sigma factor